MFSLRISFGFTRSATAMVELHSFSTTTSLVRWTIRFRFLITTGVNMRKVIDTGVVVEILPNPFPWTKDPISRFIGRTVTVIDRRVDTIYFLAYNHQVKHADLSRFKAV